MGPVRCLLLAAVCIQVSSMPLSTQLSEEEEKVTRCIMEVLAESLSTQGSERVSSSCIRLLREDERLISMLRHQHLLRELEDLSKLEKSQQHGERESSEEEELKKRDSKASGPASKRGAESKRGTDKEESKEFEKIEKVELKEREHGVSAEEKAHELLEEEEDKRSPVMKRDEGHGKRDGKEIRSNVATKRKEKKHFSDENDEDSSEELEHGRGYHGGSRGWHHMNHEDWEEMKRGSQRRMVEDPRQEETAQFETEDRGMKYFNTHMHGYHGEEKRHIYHPEEDMERERNYYNHEDEIEPERHHHKEEEEERELEAIKEQHRAEEQDIHEVEEELRKAAERLQEIHRG